MVPAVGFAGQTRSHFAAQATLETGSGGLGAAPAPASIVGGATGWIGRYLAATATGEGVAPFRAVSIGATGVAPTLWGSPDVVSTHDLAALRLAPGLPGPDELASSWPSAGLPVAAAGVTGALAVLERVGAGRGDRDHRPADGAGFGTGEDGAVFAAASSVLAAGLGTEVVMVNLGGWDTHADQGRSAGRLQQRLVALDTGVGAMLDAHDDLTVLVVSEFGRRVAENSSGGTDHGAGGLVLVAGNGVRGGVAGTWPGLTDLDDGDVRAVNDLRAVQAEVVTDVLGAGDHAEVVTGVGGGHLGLFV